MLVHVDDSRDPRLADYFSLSDPAERRVRERDEFFVIEGVTAIERLLVSRHRLRSVLVTPAKHARLAAQLDALDVPVFVAPRTMLAAVVGFDLHRGAVAVADREALPSLDDVLADSSRVAILEGLNDSENLGAIARSARALGIDGLVLDPACIDPYYRRTVRVSMGEILHLPVARVADWPSALARVHAAGFETWALTPAGDADDIATLAVPARVAVLLGAEGPGLSEAAMAAASRRVRIPIRSDVDSLNVGHAAAIAFAAIAHRAEDAGPRAAAMSQRSPASQSPESIGVSSRPPPYS